MHTRPNVLFLMSDQHNANSAGFAGHPLVRTPNLDALAKRSVRFNRAYCNNPICSPSRVCFVTGQYAHTHQILGNNNFEMDDYNPNTLGAVFRRHGYQTAMIGKGHTVRRWDEEAYEHIRYVDMTDADRLDPRTCHYFQHLVDHGIGDLYEDGGLPPEHETKVRGCSISNLPYEHSNEHYTGEQSLKFLKNRDERRPFFLKMSFERPHPPWMPSSEDAKLYDPDDIELGPDADDWWKHRWQGRPEFISRLVAELMEKYSLQDYKKMLAYHFALITVIDREIGRTLDYLRESGELENTIIVYTADHGDFAGDHGICNKNIGIYESIHHIPMLLHYPGGPQGKTVNGIVESIDLFPTLCELADVPAPPTCEGSTLVPVAEGRAPGKPWALCEWDYPPPQRFVNALRTERFRLVYYGHEKGGELYDHENDRYEMNNLWDDSSYQTTRLELLEQLFDRVNQYRRKSDFDTDVAKSVKNKLSPTTLIHKRCRKWSDIAKAAGIEE